MGEPQNPFVVGLLATGEHFADREREVERIVRAFEDAGGKLVVYGDRRLGKSSALERAAREVRGRGGKVAIASFATASGAAEACQQVLAAVQREAGRSWREVLEGIARGLNVGFEVTPSLDPAGVPSVRFSFGLKRTEAATRLLPEVLDAVHAEMERRDMTLGIGLDEFQRIHEWGGEDAEWALREAMLRHGRLAYVLAGSRRGLIEAMVGDKGRAFWKLADTLPFGAIDDGGLAEWIVARGVATGVSIPPAAASLIVRLAGPRTRDVVQLARATWFIGVSRGGVTVQDVVDAVERLVEEQAELYRTIWVGLGAREQAVLRVFAADGEVQIMAADTLARYRLGPKSSVHSAVERLVEAEHLARLGPGRYGFDDPFFRRWVQVYGLPDIGEEVPPVEA